MLIKFITSDDAEHEVEVAVGDSVMQAAVDNGVDGILAECGGACSCATCHCIVDDAWVGKTGKPSDMEGEMLDCVIDPQENSRLSCQLIVTEDMDGLIVHVPASQY